MSTAGARRPAALDGVPPVEPPRPRTPWFGAGSLVGVVVGALVWGLPYVRPELRSALWLWLLPPVLGLGLLTVRGPARRFGVGLLASCVTLPVTVLMIGLSGSLH